MQTSKINCANCDFQNLHFSNGTRCKEQRSTFKSQTSQPSNFNCGCEPHHMGAQFNFHVHQAMLCSLSVLVKCKAQTKYFPSKLGLWVHNSMPNASQSISKSDDDLDLKGFLFVQKATPFPSALWLLYLSGFLLSLTSDQSTFCTDVGSDAFDVLLKR